MDIMRPTNKNDYVEPTRRVYTTFNDMPQRLKLHNRRYKCIRLLPSISYTHFCYLYLFSNKEDVFIFNGDATLITIACLLKKMTFGCKAKIVAVDMVLRVPSSPLTLLVSAIKKRVWTSVDQFIHYFKNWNGYRMHYGIDARCSKYVPFKSNVFKQALHLSPSAIPKGDYIFSAGRSLRDYTTLIEAARLTGLPTAILCASTSDWTAHGTEVDLADLPKNVRIIQDDGKKTGWINGLKYARFVVVPTQSISICASGIGTYLDAMALGKPVILTRGPGADDVLSDEEALFVAPHSPEQLAKKMVRLWNDPATAKKLSNNGRRYALSLGDSADLSKRILTTALD